MIRNRCAGVTLPLFSIRSRHDWGIGQITDLALSAEWIRRAGHTLLQILPPHELSEGETSPYGARTAFAIDPIYIGIDAVADLDQATVDGALGVEGHARLEKLRAAPTVDYAAVRALKGKVLRAGFERFVAREWERGTPRARALSRFIETERHWLHDFALYTVLRESHDGYGWETWPEDERERAPQALEHAQRSGQRRILEIGWLQWVALEQWAHAREEMRALGVELMGDLPFVVCGESADVWSRASQFQRHLSLGAPPDAFAPDGQDWGLPTYDWLAMEGDDLAWLRARARHAARLYDRFRLDHVVGYFRQWVRPRQHEGQPNKGRFDPDGPDAQRARGLRVLGAILEETRAAEGEGTRVIAEDLGVIPPFVRETLNELATPGYRVIPWEKDGHQFRDPAHFPAKSVATWSTHDTAPITSWWDDFSDDDRRALAGMAHVDGGVPENDRTLALLHLLFRSGSDVTLTLAQELLGERARINTPGTVGDANWRYRLPRPIEDLEADAALGARFESVRRMAHETARV